ncbi:MAG: hypothetical protein R3338_02030, partial [Thermoanaerobaculia bacterium]|nr:hypothetical protein [Thermoanaerobaculia bacterium]
ALLAAVPIHADTTASSFTGQTGRFFTIDSRTLPRGDWSFGFSAANFDQLYPEAPELRPVSDRPFRGFDVDRGEFRLHAARGVTDSLELSASLPYIHYNQNIGDVAGYVEGLPRVGEFTDGGPGDLSIAAKLRFVDRSDLGIAGTIAVALPTGETDGGIASGDWSGRAGLHVDIGSLTLSGSYGYRGERSADETPLESPFDLADEIRLDLAWTHQREEWTRAALIGELNGIIFSGGDRRADDALYVTGGIRYRWGDSCWTTDAAINYNVTMAASDNPSHPIGGLLSISCRR